jgi:hypothetical protein|uniref:Uncharacterized protein n=1 Tax=viral metagenome TaxID=1070528 RepID=A0A6C0ECI5_9ZZZZ
MNNNDITLIIGILFILIFFFIILPIFDDSYNNTITNIKEELKNTENSLLFPDNSNGIPKLDNNKCSKNCCNLSTQWKLPSELFNDKQQNYTNYIPSNISCNSRDTTGCLCIEKKDFNYLRDRGKNLKNI